MADKRPPPVRHRHILCLHNTIVRLDNLATRTGTLVSLELVDSTGETAETGLFLVQPVSESMRFTQAAVRGAIADALEPQKLPTAHSHEQSGPARICAEWIFKIYQ